MLYDWRFPGWQRKPPYFCHSPVLLSGMGRTVMFLTFFLEFAQISAIDFDIASGI